MLYTHRVGGRQVNFVDDGENFEIRVQCKIGVCKRLRLNALGCVNDEHRTLAGCQRTAYLIVKVNMTRGVNEVKHIGLTVLGLVIQTHGPCLYGDTALTLEVHVIEDLILHYTLLDSSANLY